MSFLDDCDASELVGQRIGPYQIVACLRRGERTTVYRGWQSDAERAVALKVVNPDCLGRADVLQRFKQEAELSLQLDHPHVVHVYTYGEENHQPYLVMEWVDGRSLKEELAARGRLPPDDAATIAVHVARALDYLHRQGIVHRDVKPSNILLGSDGQARLSDFGVAVLSGQAPPTLGVGTAAYLAPEQTSQEPADPRSDIYSLGIVMFEMLTGRTPFEADDELGMIMQHLHATPLPLRRFVTGLGSPWEQVIGQALAKKTWERQADARVLITQIEQAARPRPRL
jgi:serine/threonine protein kinase